MIEFKRVLCPVDFSEPSHVGLRTAVELAARFSAELLVVHVVPPVPIAVVPVAAPAFDVANYQSELTKSAEEGVKSMIKDHVPTGIHTRSMVLSGEPSREIAAIADTERADIIVMATHGESGWRRFMFGSVAEKVVRVARCPVLTVPEPESK
jgi:nucleotide-binding universal stress UspA family protein